MTPTDELTGNSLFTSLHCRSKAGTLTIFTPVKMSQQIDLQARPSLSTSSCKPIPTSFACAPKLQFSYSGSPDGVDTNLLILLHGRGKIVKDAAHTVMLDMDVLAGDSEVPFAKLAGTLQLPQTATLALRGPLIVPLLDEHEREWWNETDMMGMSTSELYLHLMLRRPDASTERRRLKS